MVSSSVLVLDKGSITRITPMQKINHEMKKHVLIKCLNKKKSSDKMNKRYVMIKALLIRLLIIEKKLS